MKSMGNSLARGKGKYSIATLCVIAVFVGIAFLIKLTIIDGHGDKELSQDFTLSVLSDPPGANVYSLESIGISDSIGVTPLEMKGSYHIDRDGSGWGSSGQGIYLEPTGDAYLIYFNCIVVKDGYGISEVHPVLASIPRKDVLSNQLPSKLKYNAKLTPKEPSQAKTIGTAIMVNGTILHVNPPSLKTQDCVYMIDIKGTTPEFPWTHN